MKWSVSGLVLLGLLGAGAVVPAWAQVIPGVYTCVDAKGRKLTADRPIPECTDREQKVLNPSGTVKMRIGPTLTDRERVELEKQTRKEEDARSRIVDDKRRDRALLTRYPNKAAHDKERTEALNGIAVVTQAAKMRLTELVRQKVAIDDEMGFYQGDPTKAPASVRRQLEENLQSQAVQKRFIGDQEGEVLRVNQRFDEELARLRDLWAQMAPASSR